MSDNTSTRSQSNWPYIIAAIICFFGLFGLFDVESGEQSKGYVYILLAVAIAGFTWSDRNEARGVRKVAWTITIAALGLWAYLEYL